MPQKLYTQEEFNEKLNEFWNNLKKYGNDVLSIREGLIPKPKPLPTLPTNLINKIMMYQPRPQYIKDIKFLGSDCSNVTEDLIRESMFISKNKRKNELLKRYENFERVLNLVRRQKVCFQKPYNIESVTPFSYQLDHYSDYQEYIRNTEEPRIAYEWGREIPFWFIGKNVKSRFKWRDDYMEKELLELTAKNCCIELKKSWSRKRILQELMKL